MSNPTVIPVVDEGLGNSTYLLDLGGGRGLVLDPSRDLRAVRAAAERRGLRIAFAVDTHLHADFLSGSRQLAATDGAQLLASAAGGREFPHTGLRDEDEVDLGGLVLRALATPGHTHEHLAFLLLDGPAPVGVFTGGSLLVGSAARTDLVSPDRTEELARAQYRSLRRLTGLGDDVSVWPTHGAGSFCSAPPGVGADQHDRHREGDQHVAAGPRRGRLRAGPARFAGQLPAVLPAARRDQPPRTRIAGRHPGTARTAGGAGAFAAGRGWSDRRRPPGDRVLRRSPAGGAVHPAPAGVRDLAGLARPTGPAAGDRPGRRPGPGRDRLAGGEDRLRQPHRAGRRGNGRLARRRRTRRTAAAGLRRAHRPGAGAGHPAGRGVHRGSRPGCGARRAR